MKNDIIVGRSLLETLTSALYENPIILFREYVQNSLDAYNYATKIEGRDLVSDFHVNIDIDRESRTIKIRDNGYGIVSSEQFAKAMLSFGNSEKLDRTQFIGFRGIGRVSALPFCQELRFINKKQNQSTIDVCTWRGDDYRKILNDESTEMSSFEQTVQKIVNLDAKTCDIDNSHYFEVVISNYSLEVEEVIENPNFIQQLRKLLPIKYADDFTSGNAIISRYNQYMNEDFTDYMCSVYLDGNELRKNYSQDKHVLESGIVYLEVREKGGSDKKKPGDKMGLLWFTFDRKIEAKKGDTDYGILVRSKNVLMGDNDTFADLCTSSKEHIATYSELTATLRGVYGELLINSPSLKDNARREWFKTDENSIYLKYVIVDFMKRLYKYRYAASGYYRLKNNDKEEQKKTTLKSALVDLIDINRNAIDVGDFCRREVTMKNEHVEDHKSDMGFADEDMPRQSQTRQKNYNELMKIIESFFQKEKMYDIFIKLRAFIKKSFDE